MAGGLLNPLHLLILLAVVLIVLGPKRLPEAGRGLGEAIRGFKSALSSDDRASEERTPATLSPARDADATPTTSATAEPAKVAGPPAKD